MNIDVLIPMWWGGFSEFYAESAKEFADNVLIPMWWGGFSEESRLQLILSCQSLNPHVVGRFFRAFGLVKIGFR